MNGVHKVELFWSVVPINRTFQNLNLLWPEPELLIDNLKEGYDDTDEYLRCPAIAKEASRTIVFKSPMDYSITWTGDDVIASSMDQTFFNDFVMIRNLKRGFINFKIPIVLFSEIKTNITQYPAYMCDNEFTRNTRMLAGGFDVSSWLRPLDVPFFINRKNEPVTIKRDQPLFYVKVDTEEKIKLTKFHSSSNLVDIMSDCVKAKNYIPGRKLPFLYDLFAKSGYNKRVIKEIKQNIY